MLQYFYCENCTVNGIQPVSRCLTQYKQRKTKRMRGSYIWRGETPRIQIKPAGSTKYTDNDYQKLRNDHKRPERLQKTRKQLYSKQKIKDCNSPGCSGTQLLFIFSLRLKSHIYLWAKPLDTLLWVGTDPRYRRISHLTVPTQRPTPTALAGTLT